MRDILVSMEAENLSAEEQALLHELVYALRAIRYGSVVLTVHDRRLVEIHKTERIRKRTPEKKE